MKIVKGKSICLRTEYLGWYNHRSDFKLINPLVKVTEISEDDGIFIYTILDQNGQSHDINSEDIDFKLSNKIRFKYRINEFINGLTPKYFFK